jgi:hypothetical protein
VTVVVVVSPGAVLDPVTLIPPGFATVADVVSAPSAGGLVTPVEVAQAVATRATAINQGATLKLSIVDLDSDDRRVVDRRMG